MDSRAVILRQIKKRILTMPDEIGYGSIDLGFGYFKGALIRPAETANGSTVKTSVIPSVCGIGSLEQGLLAIDRRRQGDIYEVILDGSRVLLAGNDVALYSRQGQEMGLDRFASGSDVVRTLTYLTLYNLLGAGTHDVALVIGLPIEVLRSADAQQNVDGIAGWLKQEHVFSVGPESARVKVADLRFRSQPMGAFYDWFLDSRGQVRRSDSEIRVDGIAIASVGFRTVELFVMDNDGNFVPRYTDGSDMGVAQALSTIVASVLRTHDRELSLHEADSRLRQWMANRDHPVIVGSGGQTHDIAPLIAGAWVQYVAQLDELLRRKWGRLPFGLVIASGGGVELARQEFANFAPGAFIPYQPIKTIARGLAKLALRKDTFPQLRRWVNTKNKALADLEG